MKEMYELLINMKAITMTFSSLKNSQDFNHLGKQDKLFK